MVKWVPTFLLFLVFILSACVDQQREEQLKQREEALFEKEKLFALKEADYQTLVKMRDSILSINKDTVQHESWPDFVPGIWNSKVVCTESNCNNYVIGDVRSDQWEFGYDSIRLITKVSSSNKLVRVYSGSFKDSLITLRFSTDSTSQKQVVMTVLITEISPEKLRGTRVVKVDNACTASFSVELTKNKTKPE